MNKALSSRWKALFVVTLSIAMLVAIVIYVAWFKERRRYCVSLYPNGMNFAFTITDDPDGTKLERVQPVYGLLRQLGFFTTVLCWVYPPTNVEGLPDPEEQIASDTLSEEKYQIFLRALAKEGFEIGLHTVSSGHDLREVTFKGYERFKEIFGAYPEVNIMHSKNRENIYWGKNVFKSGLMRWLVGLYSDVQFSGEDPSSPFFWGDVCYDKTKFVRLWGTSDINTIKFNPGMPYHDSAKPYVKYWFSFSDGYTKPYFVKLVSKKHVDRLTEERGASIVYTHFAAGFTRKTDDGSYVIDPEVESCLRYLSEKKDGWFVPAGSLLERLLAFKNVVLLETKSSVTVANVNSFKIPGVTLLGTAGETLYDHVGKAYTANEEGEIIIGDLEGNSAIALYRDRDEFGKFVKASEVGVLEYLTLIYQRVKIMLFDHIG